MTAPGFISRGLLGTPTPPPPPDEPTDGVEYVVAVVDMWGCAYGQIEGVQVTQVQWQLNDKGAAAFTFPIQQVDQSVWGIALDENGLSNRAILPYSCIPGGREVQVWRNQELIWWGVPVNATPSATLVTIACEGLLWWVDGVLFGPNLSESLIDGDFEVSGQLGGLSAYWPASEACTASLVDANAGDVGIVTGRWAAFLESDATDADAYIQSNYVMGAVFDDLAITVTGWAYINAWEGEALDGRGIMVVLYQDGVAINTWATQLTADMPVGQETQITLTTDPIQVERGHVIPGPVFTVGVRLYCPHGSVTWDDCHVTVAQVPFDGTATELGAQLLAYAQDPTQAKSTFAMPTAVVGIPSAIQLQRDYLGQSANSSVLGAFAEFVAEGYFDYEVVWDPTGHFRTFTMYAPSKGQVNYNYPVTLDLGTVTDLSGNVDGSQVGTTQRALGQGSSGAGNEYAFRSFGGFLGSGRGAGFPGGRQPRIVTDAVVTLVAGAQYSTLVSATAAFDVDDVGQPVSCLTAGVLPPGAYIVGVSSEFEAVITSGDQGLITSIGGEMLTVSIGAFTIEQQQSAQTNQPPGALAGLVQGALLRNGAAQPILAPRMAAQGTTGNNGLMGNVFTGDVIPVATDYGWLTISGAVDGEPVLQRVVGLTLYPVTEEIQPTLNVINSALGGVIDMADLPGTPIAYLGTSAPDGYAICDGSGYAVADYPSLFGVIGYRYGGSGATFNVPDYRELALVGAGGGHAVGDTFGQADVTLATDNIPEFSDVDLDLTDPGHYHAAQPGYDVIVQTTSADNLEVGGTGTQAASNVGDPNTDNKETGITGTVTLGTASPVAVPTVPPSGAVLWILRLF
jgi:microcystin-dependent protein